MGEILISHIEVLVHPGYHSIYSRPSQVDQIHALLSQKWNQRLDRIAENNSSLLLYFSSQPNLDPHTDNPLKNEDIQRIIKYEQVLKDRFFLFGLGQERWMNLAEEITGRGFKYGPTCQMFVYGEYGGLCTRNIANISSHQLALNPKSVHFLPSLSRPKQFAFQALQAA